MFSPTEQPQDGRAFPAAKVAMKPRFGWSTLSRSQLALGLVAFTILALVACAPTTAGTSGGSPLVVGAAPIPVQSGNTYYLRFDLSMDTLELKPKDLEAALWVPSGYASEVGDVSSMFALHDARAADGWQVTLEQVRAERSTVTTSASFGQTKTVYSLWAVVKVQVPSGSIPGPYRVRGTLQVRSGKSVPLSATVEVQ